MFVTWTGIISKVYPPGIKTTRSPVEFAAIIAYVMASALVNATVVSEMLAIAPKSRMF